jgi:CheY-like chemotaxis protein
MSAQTQQVNVLLVEDNRLSREIASSFLEEYGLAFGVAVNGQEALDVFEKSNFNIILLDIEMPLLNGYAVANKIRESNSEIPIIAMTGHDTEEEKQKCISSGMNACISKPFEKEKLYAMILAHLNIPYTMPMGMEQPALEPVKTVTDLSHLREISKGRKVFFLSMIEIFLEQNQEDMQELEKSVYKEDFDNIRLLSHKIATSITFMGLEKHIYSKLKEMEQLGEDQTQPGKIKILFQEVAAVCAKANEELRMVKDIE